MSEDDDLIIFQEMGKGSTFSKSPKNQKEPITGRYESLYEELHEKCNPERFVEPYDKEKVDIANNIFSQLLRHPSDISLQKGLRSRAIRELGVTFCTEELYNQLVVVCHPRNYTGEHYDADSLEEANSIYNEILNHADDIEALESLQHKAKGLFDIYNARKKEYELKEKQALAENAKSLDEAKLEDELNGAESVVLYFYASAFLIEILAFVSLEESLLLFIFMNGAALLFVFIAISSHKKKKNIKAKLSELKKQ